MANIKKVATVAEKLRYFGRRRLNKDKNNKTNQLFLLKQSLGLTLS